MCTHVFFSPPVNGKLLPDESASGTGGDLLFGFSCCLLSRLSPVRANCRSTRTNRSQRKKNAGGSVPLSIFPLFFFRARAITLVCEGPLAIGMKVGSCVEIESPRPRLYTHLPTRTRNQDRARGPRPSSPIELHREGPLFSRLFAALLGLSIYLISLLVLRRLLSLSLPPTPLLALLPPLSHSRPLLCLISTFARRLLRSSPRFWPTFIPSACPVPRRSLRAWICNAVRVADPLRSRLGRIF